MKLKKMMCAVLAGACVFSMAACGNKDNSSKDGDEKKTLVMATNAEFPPFEYYEGGEVVGIDAELAAAIGEKLGMDVEIEDMAFDSVIPAVQSGKADFGAAGITITEDRKAQVDFSDEYYTSKQKIIVKSDNTEITGPEDLEGKKIGVQQGTTGDIFATDEFGDENVERYNKGMEAVQAVQQGKIDAVIIDEQPAKTFISENEGLVILETEYVEESYAFCFEKDSDLVDKVNDAIKELKEEGTFDEIVSKYINSDAE